MLSILDRINNIPSNYSTKVYLGLTKVFKGLPPIIKDLEGLYSNEYLYLVTFYSKYLNISEANILDY